MLIGLVSCQSRNDEKSSATSTIFQRLPDLDHLENGWSTANTVVVHSISEPDNLHPTNGNSAPRNEILLLTQRTLLYTDFENQTMLPGLTKGLPAESADGLRYTYHLKKGPQWDDGSALTREDILFTAKVYKCPLVNDPFVKTYWNNLVAIEFDSTDVTAFTCVMQAKNIQNKYWMGSFPILEKKFHDPADLFSQFTVEQFADTTFKGTENDALVKWCEQFNDDSNGRDPSRMNGLGMYKLTKWEAGQYLTLEKKKNHWTESSTDYHERAFPEKIIYKINKDDNSQQLEFKNQNFDVTTNISVNTFIALNEDESFRKNYDAIMSPTFNYTYIAMNQRPDSTSMRPFLKDKLVRQAIAKLVDVNKFTQLVYGKYAENCSRMVSNVSPFKAEFNSELKPIKVDLDGAKELLKKAGWSDSDHDGILDKVVNGKKVEFRLELNFLNTSPDWRDMALLFTEEMKRAGIAIDPVATELKLFLDKARTHQFDLIMGSWAMTSLPEDYTQLWHTTSWKDHGSNYSGFGNDESDQLIEMIKHETDIKKRTELSKKLQAMIYDDQPFVFLYTSLKRNVIHKRFANRMLFADRPGILINPLRLLSINPVITLQNGVTP